MFKTMSKLTNSYIFNFKLNHIVIFFLIILPFISFYLNNINQTIFISKYLLHMDKDLYGFYRINMKENSDNMRESASIEIIKILISAGKQVIIYEPLLNNTNDFDNVELVKNLDEFKGRSDIIIANRVTEEILDCKEKLFSRDLSYDTKSRPKNI